MAKTLEDQTLSLAGVFQATRLVDDFARLGSADQFAFEASIQSLFRLDPESTLDVYGGVEGVKLGLRQLRDQLTAKDIKQIDILRYSSNLLKLEKKLSRNNALLSQIREGIEGAQRQIDHFSLLHSNTLARLAGIYSDSVSKLSPRILVNGEQSYLSSPETINKIRATLLAGIRSAVLWRQNGGTRWQLLFARKAMINTIDRMIHIS